MQADTTCFICLYLKSQYMQIKCVCTKIQAVHISLYQCSITYRCRQIQHALSACISEPIHANKTCLYPDTGSAYLSVSMLQYFKGLLRTLPGRWGNSNTPNWLRLGTRRIDARGSILGAFPAESEGHLKGITREARGVRKIKCRQAITPAQARSAPACCGGG